MGGVLTALILATLVSFASCSNGSTGDSGTDSNPVIDHSLGDAPAEDLKLESSYYSVKTDDSYGIYITYKIPQGKNVQSCTVRIDGIGSVYENYGLLNESEGEFFYPFVTPNKEYTVRFAFSSKENEKDGWNYGGGECVGWFDATVKAGEKSIGEVKLVDMGKVEVRANGDFRFTRKPAFEGESLLNGKWYMNVPLVEGISWLHEDRKTKWRAELNIPSADLGKTINLYTYDKNGSWRDGSDWEIGFICPRPRMEYETKDGKKFIYQWDGFVEENLPLKPERELWQDIDINNSADIAKISGTWKYSNGGYGEYGREQIVKVIVKYEETVIIDSKNLTRRVSRVITKPDGSQFTEDEKGIVGVDSDEGRTVTVSPDDKTITRVYEPFTESISESFADREDEEDGSVRHFEVKLFHGGSVLRMIGQNIKDGKVLDEWHTDYIWQN